jgi:hypothetical protein
MAGLTNGPLAHDPDTRHAVLCNPLAARRGSVCQPAAYAR